MAMALENDPIKAENLEKLQKLSEASRAFIKEALDIEDSLINDADSLALLHYEEGLRLLDQVLAIDIPEENENHPNYEEIIRANKTRTKLSRTRQQVVFRIHELKAKLKSKSESETTANKSDDFVIEMELEDALNENMNQTSMTVPSDAKILFTIAGKVQIFYIDKNGQVSAPSYPSSLFIFKFQTDDSAAFLKVGDWVYPLIKGKSPILKSTEGAYLFPDIDEDVEGNAIGLILPEDILDVEKQQLEDLLQQLTYIPEDLKEYEDTLEYSAQISSGLIQGAEMIGKGMVKGAIKSSEWMYIGAEKLKARINPESEPRQVNPKLKTTLGAARWMTSKTVQASGYLVSKAGSATVAMGRFLAPHIKHHSAKALSHIIEQTDEKSHKQLDIAAELTSGTVTAISTVYTALENSSRILATNMANNTVQLVSHKYGNELGTATENALTSVGNAYLTSYNAAALGPKALAKRAVKTTGKLAVGVSEEVIKGLPKPVGNEENDDTKAIEHKKG